MSVIFSCLVSGIVRLGLHERQQNSKTCFMTNVGLFRINLLEFKIMEFQIGGQVKLVLQFNLDKPQEQSAAVNS